MNSYGVPHGGTDSETPSSNASGRPDGICRRSSVGVNRRVSKRQRRNPPPHRGQSPLWKNAVAPAMPSTSPLRRILGGGRLWGNLWFPTTFERSASERIPRCTSRKSKNTPGSPGCPCGEQFPGVPWKPGNHAKPPLPSHSSPPPNPPLSKIRAAMRHTKPIHFSLFPIH